jgi:tripartite-type tricarboxylate transporter receptor subunit TctC
MLKKIIRASAPILATGMLVTAPAHAQSAADFYKGKNIEVYVAAGAGGGYGLYSRVLVEFMAGHIPGHPNMTLKFMAGSAGVKAANYVYNVAPKRGTSLGFLLSSQPTSEATGRKGVKYKSANFLWLGRLVDIITVVTVNRTAPATTIDAMKKTELIAGITRPGSTTHIPYGVMNWALGTKFKIVSGYKGSAGPAFAFDRGEVHTVAAPWGTLRTRRPHLLKEIELVQVALAKDPQRLDVPLLMDLIKDPAQKQAVRFLSAQASIGRTINAPPGVPAHLVAALREAFDATMRDPKFIAAAKKRKMAIAPLSGVALQKLVQEHLATPAHIIDVAKKAVGIK